MDTNNNKEYVLVLEDRSDVKQENETGKLSVISEIDEKGKLKTAKPDEKKKGSFMKFDSKDSMLKNFMSNFLKQYNDPSRLGLYKVAVDNFTQGFDNLKAMLNNRTDKSVAESLSASAIRFDEYGPIQEKEYRIEQSAVDWKELEQLGITQDKLEKTGELDKLLNWQKTDLMTIAIPMGENTIYTEARLALRTDEEGKLGLSIHSMRKEPQLDFPYMGYEFSDEDKKQLKETGNLGKTVDLTTKDGEVFSAYVSLDRQTNEIIALRAEKVSIPNEICGVKLSDEQYKSLVEGKAVPVEGLTSRNGKEFYAKLQVNADKKGIDFIFDDSQKQGYNLGKICGVELSDKQQATLKNGGTIYLTNMVNKKGEVFNSYVKLDKEAKRPRFYQWNPDKKMSKNTEQEQGKKPEEEVKKSRGRKM